MSWPRKDIRYFNMSSNVISPSFNGFSFNDSNWITERITFKGFANRDLQTQPIARREGIKVLGDQFREKEITLEGKVIAIDSGTLQTLLDNAKQYLVSEEGTLIIEVGRQYVATPSKVEIPDQPYNQTMAPYTITFICSNPYATSAQQSAIIPVVSGQFTVSGTTTISGTIFNRIKLIYTPPFGVAAGNTSIQSITVYHVPTGQSVTVSGFGGGTNLNYNSSVTIDMDLFQTLDGVTGLNNTGSFPKWQPGTNAFTITSSPAAFPGGTLTVQYTPRYI